MPLERQGWGSWRLRACGRERGRERRCVVVFCILVDFIQDATRCGLLLGLLMDQNVLVIILLALRVRELVLPGRGRLLLDGQGGKLKALGAPPHHARAGHGGRGPVRGSHAVTPSDPSAAQGVARAAPQAGVGRGDGGRGGRRDGVQAVGAPANGGHAGGRAGDGGAAAAAVLAQVEEGLGAGRRAAVVLQMHRHQRRLSRPVHAFHGRRQRRGRRRGQRVHGAPCRTYRQSPTAGYSGEGARGYCGTPRGPDGGAWHYTGVPWRTPGSCCSVPGGHEGYGRHHAAA